MTSRPFLQYSLHEQLAIRDATDLAVQEYLERTREAQATPRQIYEAIGPHLCATFGVVPDYVRRHISYVYNKKPSGSKRKNGTSTAPKVQAALETESDQKDATIHTNSIGVVEGILVTVDRRDVYDAPLFFTQVFTPYAALTSQENDKPTNSAIDFLRSEQHRKLLYCIIDGSIAVEADADFIGVLRLARTCHQASIETNLGANEIAKTTGPTFPSIRVHVRTLLWRLGNEPRRGDFCDLIRELYEIRREAAWRIGRTLVRAAYLDDWESVDEALQNAHMLQLSNKRMDRTLESHAQAALAILWAKLSKKSCNS